MTTTPPLSSAADFCQQRSLALSEAAMGLAAGSPTQGFAQRLLAEGHPIDAIRYLAQALERRQAAHWACAYARGTSERAEEIAALEAAEAALASPGRPHTAAVKRTAEAAPAGSAAAYAAWATFFAADDIGPPGMPALAPLPHLAGVMAASAVLAAVAAAPEPERPERYRQALALGLTLARPG